ncbi:hypothetical protein FJTKL_09516 [Diaporthe vaccinii]|uniref:Uncharacterized protein n=1 Tax=Diaporthe vaccinii TaxID=105482 RepID=A0ABR4FCZ0_9PEZI
MILADKFARHAWRKQAIDAVFPTDNDAGECKEAGANLFSSKDHPWLASNRAAKIEELAAQLLRAFRVFANILPDAISLTRNIISHAVRLSEYMMHESQVTYTVDLETSSSSDDEFYENLNNMTLSAVNTDSGWLVKVESAMKDMLESDIRRHLYKVCAIEPALRSQSWSGSDALDLQYGPVKTEVKSTVAVGWALNRNNPPEKESMFYIMARSLGFVP